MYAMRSSFLPCFFLAVTIGVAQASVGDDLLSELVAGLPAARQSSRLPELQAVLQPMYVALPKDADGRLSQPVVRYALHRLMVQEHGWYIKGLEPNGTARNDSSASGLKQWVPSYLHRVIERIESGEYGLGLRELAALGATIENLVHDDAIKQMKAIYEAQGLSIEQEVVDGQADELVQLYMMGYLQGGNYSYSTSPFGLSYLETFRARYPGWSEVADWMSGMAEEAGAYSRESLTFDQVASLAEDFGSKFGVFNDVECADLKETMINLEDKQKPGRVNLAEFYGVGLHTHWNFTEKADYLRVLGALDETTPGRTSVIIPNYLASRPQCLEATTFYAVCCRNECEDMMGAIEERSKNPVVDPASIVAVIEESSKKVSEGLVARLQQVAEFHGGKVPLHSRLFAQWMHHVFPRECPFPHEAGAASPQTPDEWMAATGEDSTKASEEEMVCHISGPCSVVADENAASMSELPWSDTEELLVEERHNENHVPAEELVRFAPPVAQEPSPAQTESLSALTRWLRNLVLSGVALGVALACKLNMSRSELDKKYAQLSAGWRSAIGLVMIPCVVVTIDFAIDLSMNDLLMCIAMIAVGGALMMQMLGGNGKPDAVGFSSDKSFV